MYYILLDTNFLYINYDSRDISFENFEFNRSYHSLRTTVEDSVEAKNCKIIVPELVIEELLKQRKDAYLSTVKSFKEAKRALGIKEKTTEPEDEKSFVERSRKEIHELFERDGIEIIKNCDSSYFYNIISDSIDKKPPFEGEKGKSDKGFKDIVIWYSGIQYAKIHSGNYILLTKDDIFSKNERLLERNFYAETHQRVKFAKECCDVEGAIQSFRKERNIVRAGIIDEHQESKTYCSNGCSVSMEWIKPVLTNEKGDFAEINRKIDTIYDSVFEEWENECHSLEASTEERTLHFNDSLKYKVLFNDNGILSIRFERYAYYDEGVHGMPYWIPCVFDLNSGDLLEMPDFIEKNEEDLFKLITDKFNDDFAARPDVYFDSFTLENYHCVSDFKFFYDENGVHIYFEPYEAGCYASGFINFNISK